jgi:hypothetical protein
MYVTQAVTSRVYSSSAASTAKSPIAAAQNFHGPKRWNGHSGQKSGCV